VLKDRKAFIKFSPFFYLSSQGRNVMNMDSANTSVTSTTEDQRPSSRLTRSRSLETSKGRATLRSRSLDCAGDRSSPEADEDEEAVSGQRFVVLADYMALTSREIDLNEDEVLELIKVGCAGWWYVRIFYMMLLALVLVWAPSASVVAILVWAPAALTLVEWLDQASMDCTQCDHLVLITGHLIQLPPNICCHIIGISSPGAIYYSIV
jgi:hypothetical protein